MNSFMKWDSSEDYLLSSTYRGVMLRVDLRQGAPKDGNSPVDLFELFQVALT